jgi:two-component system, chemotaxis family, CheB/CheR fusion protein
MSNFRPVEKSISAGKGRWYQRKIRPYRTIENKIDGAVITIITLSADNGSRTN